MSNPKSWITHVKSHTSPHPSALFQITSAIGMYWNHSFVCHLLITCLVTCIYPILCLLTVDLHFNQAPIHEMESKNDTHGLLICFWTKHFEKILQKHLNFITPIISLQGHRVKLQPKVPSKLRQRNLKTQLYYLWLGLPSTLIRHANGAFNFKKALQTRGIQKHRFCFHEWMNEWMNVNLYTAHIT